MVTIMIVVVTVDDDDDDDDDDDRAFTQPPMYLRAVFGNPNRPERCCVCLLTCSSLGSRRSAVMLQPQLLDLDVPLSGIQHAVSDIHRSLLDLKRIFGSVLVYVVGHEERPITWAARGR